MRPRIVKEAQKIFRSMHQVYRLCQASSARPAAQRDLRIWQIRVLTAKLRRLLKQAVPAVMLVMQVIDETNHACALFRRTSRSLQHRGRGQLRGRAKWAADERG